MPYKDPVAHQACCRRWKQEHRDKVRGQNARYRARYTEKERTRHKAWRLANPEKAKASTASWKSRNLERSREIQRIGRKRRLKNDVNFRLAHNLRCRLHVALRGERKSGSAVRDLGISIADFRSYISALFKSGMTWDNWGKVWHLDHIKPLASFDLADRAQFLEACHYTNLQPMSVEDNLRKGRRI